MKWIVLSLLVLTGCASVPKNQYCLHLDDSIRFARCETTEVICYESVGGQQCWVKQPPAKAPAPVPQKK